MLLGKLFSNINNINKQVYMYIVFFWFYSRLGIVYIFARLARQNYNWSKEVGKKTYRCPNCLRWLELYLNFEINLNFFFLNLLIASYNCFKIQCKKLTGWNKIWRCYVGTIIETWIMHYANEKCMQIISCKHWLFFHINDTMKCVHMLQF